MKPYCTLFVAVFALATALPLGAEPAVVTDQLTYESLAAIIDDDVVTFLDIDQQSAETVKLLRQNLTGDELNEQIKKTKLNVIKALTERILIIHEFKREGRVISDYFVQKRIDDVIRVEYGGDAGLFKKALTDRDETLEEYKTEIIDNSIVQYMRDKNVIQKVDSLKPANSHEKDQITAKIQATWLNTLYQKSYVKNFFNGL